MIYFHNTDRPAPLHRREGLNQFLSTPASKPQLRDTLAMSDVEREAYDRARIVHLSGGIVLGTPHLTQARNLLAQCFAENIGRNSGHAGLILSGASTLGKTTIAKSLMRYIYGQYKRQFPGFDPAVNVPVVYIEVPAASTGKLLMKTFADFFGLHVQSRESMASMLSRITDVINAAGAQLIVVDELQNLAGRSTGLGESVDVLKNLHNDLAATFLYAGIDLTSGSLLAGSRGNQIASRFNILEMSRYTLSDPKHRKDWRGLVRAFEKDLVLHDHELGSLAELSDYLYQRTNGSIGSLARLLLGSAIEAITNPELDERIDKALLDTRKLDFTAETAYALRKARMDRSKSDKAA